MQKNKIRCYRICTSDNKIHKYMPYKNNHRIRVGVIKIVIVINCNLITFSNVNACNCNEDISLITVIECN